MENVEREALLQQLDEARQKLRAILARIDLSQEIYPTWTIKQLLAHLAGWDEACIASLEAFLGGDEPGTPAARGIDFYNTQSVETRQELDFDHIRREYEFTREQLKAVIRRVPDARFDEQFVLPWGALGNVKRLINIFIHHEVEHAEEIEAMINHAEQQQQEAANPSATNV